jgi:hypothetical protein
LANAISIVPLPAAALPLARDASPEMFLKL